MEQELALDLPDDGGIIGFSASFEHGFGESLKDEKRIERQIAEFRGYMWGPGGLAPQLQSLKPDAYGKDLQLILFQCYVFPSDATHEHIKEIEGYNAREKSVTLSIVVPHSFFDKPEEQRHAFLVEAVASRLKLLPAIVATKKLDTKIGQLIQDVTAVLGVSGSGGHVARSEEDESTDENLDQQPVTVTLRFRSGEALGTEEERKMALELEDNLNATLDSYGEVDGHDVGGGEYTIYLYGPDINKLFRAAKKVVDRSAVEAFVSKGPTK